MGKDFFFEALDDVYSSVFDLSKGENILRKAAEFPVGFAHPPMSRKNVNRNPVKKADNGLREIIAPHLTRAAHISHTLSSGLSAISVHEHMLEQFPHALLILDDGGRIMRLNSKAAQIADGIIIADSAVTIVRKTDDKLFHKAVHKLIDCRSEYQDEGGRILSLLRPSGKRPYTVFLVPVPTDEPVLIYSKPALLVIITDPDENPDQITSAARDIYRLSEREAELTGRLLEGLTLPKAAKAMSIGYETARTMIKRIFRKTGCKSQTQLVRMMLTIVK